MTTDMQTNLTVLEREIKELRRANDPPGRGDLYGAELDRRRTK